MTAINQVFFWRGVETAVVNSSTSVTLLSMIQACPIRSFYAGIFRPMFLHHLSFYPCEYDLVWLRKLETLANLTALDGKQFIFYRK